MEDLEKRKVEAVSDFIAASYQLLPKSYDAVSNPLLSGKEYVIRCGSTMEFKVRPAISFCEDVDVLILKCDHLAFAEDLPVLPNDLSLLHDAITCYRIEPYPKYPGFARLRLWGEIKYNWKYKKYEYDKTTDIIYIHINMASKVAARHLRLKLFGEETCSARGPAFTILNHAVPWSTDSIVSLWYPRWPKEAQNWCKRSRNYGLPTIDTLSKVVQQGCHLVYAQHRSNRSDIIQWRYSFSVAEVILIHSWTQTQQIVYHLLRFFAKKELIDKDCPKENEILCTYHLKTLMLWTCEEMSPKWWNSLSVIEICCKLLIKLSEWLKKRIIPHYFIPEANLFHEPLNLTMLSKIERQVMEFCKSGILCEWFFKNYYVPILLTYYRFQSNKVDMEKCISSLHEIRERFKLKSLDLLLFIQYTCCNIYSRKSINFKTRHPRSILNQMRFLTDSTLLGDTRMAILPMPVDVSCFTYFNKTIYCLNTAYSLGHGEITWDEELIDYVKGIFLTPKIVRCQLYHMFPEPLNAEKSHCQFLRAQELMENLTGLNSHSEFQLLSVISTEFLKKALTCKDSQSNSIASESLIYMAALRFVASDYQLTIDLCSAVLLDQTRKTDSETLNARSLLFIDDVARIVGFCLICIKLNDNSHLTEQRIYLDLRLNTNLFAHYLTIASAEKMSKQIQLIPNLPASEFPLDQFFLALNKRKSYAFTKLFHYLQAFKQCVYLRMDSVTKIVNSCMNPLIVYENIMDLLTECAIENMISFYSVIRNHYDIQCSTVDCYRALYLYKCCKYDEVLHLCERIIDEPDPQSYAKGHGHENSLMLPPTDDFFDRELQSFLGVKRLSFEEILQNDSNKFAFRNVLVMPPFNLLFDRDVQSLVGFYTLSYYLSPLNDDLWKFKLASQYLSQGVKIGSLLKHYNVTSYHFLGCHFLARYLKLRCHIDCLNPCIEEIAEFAAIKINHPFEHIICQFVLLKLCKMN